MLSPAIPNMPDFALSFVQCCILALKKHCNILETVYYDSTLRTTTDPTTKHHSNSENISVPAITLMPNCQMFIVNSTKMQTKSAVSHFFIYSYKYVYNSKQKEIFFPQIDTHMYGQHSKDTYIFCGIVPLGGAIKLNKTMKLPLTTIEYYEIKCYILRMHWCTIHSSVYVHFSFFISLFIYVISVLFSLLFVLFLIFTTYLYVYYTIVCTFLYWKFLTPRQIPCVVNTLGQ